MEACSATLPTATTLINHATQRIDFLFGDACRILDRLVGLRERLLGSVPDQVDGTKHPIFPAGTGETYRLDLAISELTRVLVRIEDEIQLLEAL